MAKEETGGVWRTIGGRRVFIKDGQSLADAMKESGKFKSSKKDEEKLKELAKETGQDLKQIEKETDELINENDYAVYKKARQDPDSIGPMTENSTDWEALDKMYKKRYEKELEQQYADDLHNGKTNGTFKQWLDKKNGKTEFTKEELNNLERIGEKKIEAGENWRDKLKDPNKRNEILDKELDESTKKRTKEFWTKEDEQFEVGELKAKALETLPKEDIDTHASDLYIKKTDKSTKLLNNMKNKDSGLLSTFRDENGEEWYDVPFANMQDDYQSKVYGSDVKKADERMKEVFGENFKYAEDLEDNSPIPKQYKKGEAPFESKRVAEEDIREKGYQYFSTHGVGPGTHPKDVKVRETDDELPGGWTTFKTDRPLTQKELDYYDIQPETRNAEFRRRFGLDDTNRSKDRDILIKHDLNDNDPSFKRQMLGRMESDNKYYLGNGGRNERHLWAHDVDEQIGIMKALYNTLPEKERPDWLTMKDIENYEKQMKSNGDNYDGTREYLKKNTTMTNAQINEYIRNLKNKK